MGFIDRLAQKLAEGASLTTAMMAFSSRRSMVQPLTCSLGLGLLIATAPTAALAEVYVPFPSQDSLRQVQLAALACARENTAASCEQARRLADPLLDHPRLPTGCKDHLWAISQKAQPAASNSFERREAIGQPAQLLLLACRSGEQKPAPTPAPAAGSGGGGFKFGGGR